MRPERSEGESCNALSFLLNFPDGTALTFPGIDYYIPPHSPQAAWHVYMNCAQEPFSLLSPIIVQ